MRTIKLILLALILLVIVVLSLANREIVTLHLLPADIDYLFPAAVQLPLFVVGLLSVITGMVIGYLFEWLREHKHRRRAALKAREANRLEREVDRLKKSTGKADDDVLALLGN